MRFYDVFPKRPVFLAVVHAESTVQAVKEAGIARDNGADGVFLINHNTSTSGISAHGLICAHQKVREAHPSWWIGLNMLDLERPLMALNQVPDTADGLWTDSLDHPDSISGVRFSNRLRERRAVWHGLYFGGVALKGQPEEADIAAAARQGSRIVDVVTTSGDRTGSPPSVAKIAAIREGAEDTPVSIASGIDSENVADYAGLADCFMVASSIGKSFTELDALKVRALSDAIERLRTR